MRQFSKKIFFALSLAALSGLGLFFFKEKNQARAPKKITKEIVLTPAARELYGQILNVEAVSAAESIVVTGLIASQTFFVPARFACDCEKAYNGIVSLRAAAQKDLPPDSKMRLYIENLAREITRVGPEELCATRRAVDTKLFGENLREAAMFNDEQIALQSYAEITSLRKATAAESEACKKSARNLAKAYRILEEKGFPVRESGLVLKDIEDAAKNPDSLCPRKEILMKESRPSAKAPSSRLTEKLEPR